MKNMKNMNLLDLERKILNLNFLIKNNMNIYYMNVINYEYYIQFIQCFEIYLIEKI